MAPLPQDAELRVMGQDLRPSGHERVTAAGILVSQLLLPVLRQFAQAFPDVTLEFTASLDHHSLARREADVTLRVSDSVPDWLISRELGRVDFAVFGLRRGAAPSRNRCSRWHGCWNKKIGSLSSATRATSSSNAGCPTTCPSARW
jgi:DNA-binding transcriptional LysR family regulator